MKNFEGSPVRRIGYQQWLRNLAIAIGNANLGEKGILALKQKYHQADTIAQVHIDWAIEQLKQQLKQQPNDIEKTQKNPKIPSPAPFKAKKYYLPAEIPCRFK